MSRPIWPLLLGALSSLLPSARSIGGVAGCPAVMFTPSLGPGLLLA